jgi:hypothetical protein
MSLATTDAGLSAASIPQLLLKSHAFLKKNRNIFYLFFCEDTPVFWQSFDFTDINEISASGLAA